MALTRSIQSVLDQARVLLQDTDGTNPAYRYSDQELLDAFNGAMVEARQKRPDLFLGTSFGMRGPVLAYEIADLATPFPLTEAYFTAFLYYVVGRSSMREDTYSDDSRAVVMMNKFVSQLLAVSS